MTPEPGTKNSNRALTELSHPSPNLVIPKPALSPPGRGISGIPNACRIRPKRRPQSTLTVPARAGPNAQRRRLHRRCFAEIPVGFSRANRRCARRRTSAEILLVADGRKRARQNFASRETRRLGSGVGIKSRRFDIAATGPESRAAHFVRVGFARNRGRPRDARARAGLRSESPPDRNFPRKNARDSTLPINPARNSLNTWSTHDRIRQNLVTASAS